MPRASTFSSLALLVAVAATAIASAGPASADHKQERLWRSDLLMPAVLDRTRAPGFWRVSDAVAEWSDLDANIDPQVGTGDHAQIVILERSRVSWLAKSEVRVQDGYVIGARIVLNSALRRSTNGLAIADQVLCHELGRVLGLRGGSLDSCMSTRHLGRSTAPDALDGARLGQLYSTASSSASTDPSMHPGPARWITFHVLLWP